MAKAKVVKEFSEDELFTPPTNKDSDLMEDFLSDKYTIYIVNNDERMKVRENNGWCWSPNLAEKCKENRCMCKKFRFMDKEGLCDCGIFEKKLNSPEVFKKRRKATLSGRFQDED